MTEQEAKTIKWVENIRDNAFATLDYMAKEATNINPLLYYSRKAKAEVILNAFNELEQYRALGTVEELREAIEKQVPKKPLSALHEFSQGACPTCHAMQFTRSKFCCNCGQKLDWSDEN